MKIRYMEINNFRGIKKLSWKILGNFICLIGAGDSCKSTILDAIDYALCPRRYLDIDDSDFYNQVTSNPIEIKITLSDFNLEDEAIKKFFAEDNYGRYFCGIKDGDVIPEPDEEQDNCQEAITIVLKVNDDLEPKWFVEQNEEKTISASGRAIFGVSRIGISLDNNFSWQKNSLLTRLANNQYEKMNRNLALISREVKKASLNHDGNRLATTQIIQESKSIGVKLVELSSKIDIRRLSVNSGVLTLHQDEVPISKLGNGSKKLISCAMQLLINNGHNITLIDEIELGLEPHRIRGLLNRLKQSEQQVFITSHSPVVIRELNVNNNELYACQRSSDGTVVLTSFKEIPDSQSPLRSNAEAFLSKKIIVCEGATEIGCLRALDEYKASEGDIPVWSLSTAYFDANGIDKVKTTATKLQTAGYEVLIFCDNDTPKSFSEQDVTELENQRITVIQWENGNSIEEQLFADLDWQYVIELINIIIKNNNDLSQESIVDSVKNNLVEISVDDTISQWHESEDLRNAIKQTAKRKSWFKRIDYSKEVFKFALSKLPENSVMLQRLNELWNWIQDDR
ncbi:MAG: hypothetical protein Tsb005_18820 [Gammaproteobacteria bacterium]